MKYHKAADPENQVMYLGRWVNKNTFRAFVYSETEEKLANSYDDFEKLIATGVWYPERPKVSSEKMRKPKNGTDN